MVAARGWNGLRRGRRWAAAATAALLVADAAAAFHLIGAVHPVTVSAAVARYRAHAAAAPQLVQVGAAAPSVMPAATAQGATPGSVAVRSTRAIAATSGLRAGVSTAAVPAATAASAVPPTPPGVYSYATSGSEHITTLGGITHTYPATTTVTVTPIACGVDAKWQPLDARYDDYALCASGHAVDIQSLVTYHDFDGQVDRKVYTCDPGTAFRPESGVAGTTFSGRCTASGAAAALSGKVVGLESLSVGGVAVQCLHVHIDETLSGSVTGTRTHELWFAVRDNLIVKHIADTDAPSAQTTFGPTHYTEHLAIMLDSLTPAR